MHMPEALLNIHKRLGSFQEISQVSSFDFATCSWLTLGPHCSKNKRHLHLKLLIMARLINKYTTREHLDQRVIRNRSSPLDIYRDEELIEMFRYRSRDIFELIEALSLDLHLVLDAAFSLTLQLLYL